jgi:hypothetical protein
VLLVLLAAPLFSQIGQYPYPPLGRGPQLPVPVPGRDKQGGATRSDALQRSTGTLKKVDEKSIVIDAADGRKIEFKRSEKTRFFRDAHEIAASELKPGDEVAVEAAEDRDGFLLAKNVYFEKKAAAASSGTAAEADARAPGNTPEPPPAARDTSDPGPPVLKRGEPPKEANSESADEDIPADSATPAEAAAPTVDPVIERARQATEQFALKLPNYVCKEYMTRYESSSRPVSWQPLDVVSTEVVYEDGKESYRDVSVNGKPVRKGMEGLSGAWSTGEFAPSTGTSFEERGESVIAGTTARVFNFEVERPRSHWHVQVPSQSLNPAYKGSVWIEPASGRVLRIEMQARSIPEAFPLDTVESAIDYDRVSIGDAKFLLPVHAETLACQRGTSDCSRNAIDFRNYHKYEAESSVSFGDEK